LKKEYPIWKATKKAMAVSAFIIILFFTSIIFFLTLQDFKGIVFKETINRLTYFILMVMYLLAGITILVNIYEILFPKKREVRDKAE